jgi:hypothetical protein
MSDSVVPITLYKTSTSGVLPTAAVDRSVIKQESWQQTTYPNGAIITRLYYDTIEIYNSHGVLNKYNQPNQIDRMI